MRSLKLFLLFHCKLLGLFYLARRLTSGRLKILCYHGFELDDETKFRPKLFITPKIFDQRLSTIKRYGFQVLPLDEAVDRLYAGTLPANALVVTFDDGFHSFHRLGVPCLERYGIAATVYVTTYYVQHRNPIFRLVVQYMFWKTVRREIRLRDVSWCEDRVVDLSDQAQSHRTMWACIEYGERLCSEAQRCDICEDVGVLLGVPYKEIVQSKMLHLMSPDELRTLANSNVAIELHTHRHSFPSDDEMLAEREIADNRAALQEWIAGERRHFCYPSGLWAERQWGWLDRMHVKSSMTCVSGLNSRFTPRHALRRFLDCEGIHQLEFEAALSGFVDLARSFGARFRKDTASV